ncbi:MULTISPECIES: DUF2322 family protein [unclassified Brevundimonas]|uniref:DUF2322 family protein n=1 Tax=unclassified Brevundimonas TaxID=2622653 RepID=UPI0025BD44DA|nr:MULTISPECIES: DUF2322 family protein [unclassified Brevundimonas]
MIQPTASFKDNLQLLPSIEGLSRIELLDGAGTVVAIIENQPGKQGSLAVYQYLHLAFGGLTAEAAAHGLELFGEHTPDAKARPGAHPNIDRLIEIVEGGAPLSINPVSA